MGRRHRDPALITIRLGDSPTIDAGSRCPVPEVTELDRARQGDADEKVRVFSLTLGLITADRGSWPKHGQNQEIALNGAIVAGVIAIVLGVVIGLLAGWIDKPAGLSVRVVWIGLVVTALVLVGVGLYQDGVFTQKTTSARGSSPITEPQLVPPQGNPTSATTIPPPVPASTTGRNPVKQKPVPETSTLTHSSPAAAPHDNIANQAGGTWSGPPSVSVSPTSFENLNQQVDLTVTVRSTANAPIEAETVGLDVSSSPPNCPSLKPDPCDNQFSGGQYGGTDSAGNLVFTIPWFPGDACNYSRNGDEFTYPKGTFDFSIDVQDANTGLVSSANFAVTNGADTPDAAPSC